MEELLRLAKAGDKKAESRLFEEILVRFRLFAEHRLGKRMEADDVAQQASITVLSKYRDENFTVSFEAWAYGVFRMTLQSFFRDSGRESRRTVDGADCDDQLASEQVDPTLKISLRECLKELLQAFPRYTRILNLHFHGYNSKEISSRMHLKTEQVYVYLGRGRSMLKECLDRRKVRLPQ
jgi:RNA polymerase sigma factor (sigma-70 family)